MQKNIIDMTTMICYRILVDEQYRLTSDDNREKLQAMELFKDTHLVKLELLSNATAIDSALNYIRNKQQEKRLSSDSASDHSNNDSDSRLTTTGRQTVF
jgi:hypothetical protein